MGCFSWLCDGCGKGIKSTSFSGEKCKLFLLKKGKVIQQMEGQYDSYGACFIEGTQRKDVKHKLKESLNWANPFPENPDSEAKAISRGSKSEPDYWGLVCNLLFDKDKSNGIAAFHKKCYKGETPTTRSESDPNQGWGENDELFGDCDDDKDFDKEE